MAGFSPGAAFVQGQAAGFQGRGLELDQLLQDLRVQAARRQMQDAEEAKQAQGGGYGAILALLGQGGAPGALPVSPAPGTNSAAPPQPAQGAPTATPVGTGEQMDVGAAPAPAPAPTPAAPTPTLPGQGPSPARQVLEGRPNITVPQAPQPNSMTLPSLIGAVEKSMPGAPPQVKMMALEKLSGLMNEQAKTEFARMEHMFKMQLSVAQLEQRAQDLHDRSMDRKQSMADRAMYWQQSIEARQDAAAARLDFMRYAEGERTARLRETNQTRRDVAGIRANSTDLRTRTMQEIAEGKLDLDKTKVENLRVYRDRVLELKDLGLDQRAAELQAKIDIEAAREAGRAARGDQADATRRRGQDISSEDRRYGTDTRADTARRGQDLRFDAEQARRELQAELGGRKLDLDETKIRNTQWYHEGVLNLRSAGLSQRAAEAEMRERVAQMRDQTTQRGQDISSADRQRGQDTSSADRRYGVDTRAATTQRGQDVASADRNRAIDARLEAVRNTKEYRDAIVALKAQGLDDAQADRVVKNRLAERRLDVQDTYNMGRLSLQEQIAENARRRVETQRELGLLANDVANRRVDVQDLARQDRDFIERQKESGRNSRDANRLEMEGVKEEGRGARAAAHDAARSAIAEQANATRERLAGINKLTPEQQLMRNQLNNISANYRSAVAAAGPNSPQAKLLEKQMAALVQRIEGTLTQQPPGAVQPTPNTIPLRPQNLSPAAQWSPSRQQWRDNGKIYDAQGQPVP